MRGLFTIEDCRGRVVSSARTFAEATRKCQHYADKPENRHGSCAVRDAYGVLVAERWPDNPRSCRHDQFS